MGLTSPPQYPVNILLVVPYYPHAGHTFSGAFNARTAEALRQLCARVEVLVPRPYVPPGLAALLPRWQAYAQIPVYEVRHGIAVYRPAYLELPRFGAALWRDYGAFLTCRRTARYLHAQSDFDVIISLDLFGAGGLAWRLAQDLGVPACGWATGRDLAQPAGSRRERVVLRALQRLDLVFYQSQELFGVAAALLRTPQDRMPGHKHMVLARGIGTPPTLPYAATRQRVRSTLGIAPEQILVLNLGRMVQDKGVFELLEAMALAGREEPRVVCALVGAQAGFDETLAVQSRIAADAILQERVRLLPACPPQQVWDYLCAADIFAFPSHQRYEGMPNSLLEAMSMGLPAVAFGIPPVLEIDAAREALLHVPPCDAGLFAQALLTLARDPEKRRRLGAQARAEVLSRFMVHHNMATALRALSPLCAKLRSSAVERVTDHHA